MVLVIFLAVPQKSLGQVIPTCPEAESNEGAGCPACGLTRAFYSIKSGEYQSASKLNRAGIPLLLLFCANTMAFMTVMVLNRKKSL